MNRKRLAMLSTALIFGSSALAHQGHPHHGTVEAKADASEVMKRKLEQINQSYKIAIKPIFQKKCFDCHSNQTQYPWYSKVPGVKQLIASDIAEAKVHLDFSNDFPFQGHGTPGEDLEAIQKSVSEGIMPPWRYRILHSGSKVTDEERALIAKWVSDSQKLIK